MGPRPCVARIPLATAVSGGGATYQILVFPPGASGNASPTRTISSPQMTDMGALGQIAVDTGTIYVAQPSGNAVLQFPLGANGTVNATELTGAATGFDKPMYLSVDYLDRLVVLNFANQTLLRFAAGCTGNTAPATTVNISSFDASNDSAGLCLDGQGNEFVPNGSTDAVGFFPSSDTGTASPSRTISGSMTNLEAPDACTVH